MRTNALRLLKSDLPTKSVACDLTDWVQDIVGGCHLRLRTREAWTAPRAPARVLAYHGCRIDVAKRLLGGEAFRRSTNDYDWLGSGIYFWEYAPYRAFEWAERLFGDNGAVIEATVSLTDCLNLLDSANFASLQTAYAEVVETLESEGIPVPVNKGGRHMLDRVVVDRFCKQRASATGVPFGVVRGCFPEGAPVFKGSQILRYTHVQIAVRESGCISNLKLVHFDQDSSDNDRPEP
jgi:hypothetical protein